MAQPATVEEYLAGIAPEQAAALRRVREIALRALPGRRETLSWGMVAYRAGADGSDGGDADFSFAARKRYLALYVRPDVVERHADVLSGVDHGVSCLRFPKPAAIDFDLVERLLTETARSAGPA